MFGHRVFTARRKPQRPLSVENMQERIDGVGGIRVVQIDGRNFRCVHQPRPNKTEAQKVVEKAVSLGVPAAQIQRGMHAIVDVKLDQGERAVTSTTLVNRGGTPVARWTAANLLSDSQIAAIDHCNRLWGMLTGKSLVMDLARVPGGGEGNGWAETEALDDLRRIKGYFPAKWWGVFENVCRFDEPAGFAGSNLTDCRNDQVAAARTTVQFVADIIAMKERL